MGLSSRHLLPTVLAAACLLGSAHAQVTVPLGGNISVPPGGNMNIGCNGLIVQGTFNVGSGMAENTGNISINPAGTLNGGAGTLSVNGNWTNAGTFNAGTGTVVFTDGCAAGPRVLTGTTVFNNLSFISTSGRNFVVPAGANITVNGTLTLQGTPSQPINLTSSSGQTAVITLGASARVVRDNATSLNVEFVRIPGIPTLSQYGLMLLALLMAAGAVWHQRRDKPAA